MNTQKDDPGMAAKINHLIFKNKYGSFPTQSRDRTRNLLKEILKKFDHGCFVEIGVYGGSSLFYIKDKFPQIKIYGIDPHDKIQIFNGQKINQIDQKNVELRIKNLENLRTNIEESIKKHNLDIKYINDTSWNVYNIFPNKSIDVLFVDGDHSYEGVKKDLELFYPKMNPKGVIIMDDYNWLPIKKAANEFVKKHNLAHKVPQGFPDNTKLVIYLDSNQQ